MTTFAVLLIYLGSVIASAVIANRKGNPIGGTFLGLVLGPVGLLIVLLSGDANCRSCPYCAESIKKKAIVCPHRQQDVAAA